MCVYVCVYVYMCVYVCMCVCLYMSTRLKHKGVGAPGQDP